VFNEHLEHECFTLVNIIDATIITHLSGVAQSARSYRLIGASKAPKGAYDIGAILPELGGLQQIQTYLPPNSTGGKTYALKMRARITIMGQEQLTRLLEELFDQGTRYVNLKTASELVALTHADNTALYRLAIHLTNNIPDGTKESPATTWKNLVQELHQASQELGEEFVECPGISPVTCTDRAIDHVPEATRLVEKLTKVARKSPCLLDGGV
jgi:hypothetical protein